MNKNKIFILEISFILLSLVFLDYTYACSISLMPTNALLRCSINEEVKSQEVFCLNENCAFNTSKGNDNQISINMPQLKEGIKISESVGIPIGHIYLNKQRGDRVAVATGDIAYENVDILEILDKICVEDVSKIKPIIIQKIESWRKEQKGNLVFEPYSAERELELSKNKNNIRQCHYTDFTIIGNWIISEDQKLRDYCYVVQETCGWHYSISHLSFFTFLLANLSPATLPYLIGYLFIILIIIGFLMHLERKKELGSFFKLTASVVLFVILSSLLYLVLGFGIVLFSHWVTGSYILAIIIKHIFFKSRKK